MIRSRFDITKFENEAKYYFINGAIVLLSLSFLLRITMTTVNNFWTVTRLDIELLITL